MTKFIRLLAESGYVDPLEVNTNYKSVQSLVDRKRDVCFIAKSGSSEKEWSEIQNTIKENGLKSMYVKGNPYGAYVVYAPGSENKATKLKDIAEKYGGFLAHDASDKDQREIGKLLNYDPKKVEEYIEKRKNTNTEKFDEFSFLKEVYSNDAAKVSETDKRNIGKLLESSPEEVKKFVSITYPNISLKEGKQVGLIYHFTDYEAALKIIKDHYVLKNIKPNSDNETYISFTRNRDLKSPTISRNVRFTIDGDSLSNRYKIEPFADLKAGFGRRSFDEAEERVNVEAIGGKLDFSKYLKEIDVMRPGQIAPDDEDEAVPEFLSGYENLVEYLKKNNIKFNVVNSYARKAV